MTLAYAIEVICTLLFTSTINSMKPLALKCNVIYLFTFTVFWDKIFVDSTVLLNPSTLLGFTMNQDAPPLRPKMNGWLDPG